MSAVPPTTEEDPMEAAATRRDPSGVGALLRVPVQLWLVVALMAMSFGAGVIVRTIAEPAASQAPAVTLPGQVLAPPLTDQQIQQGALPSGHPDLSGTGSASNGGAGTKGDGG